MAQKCQNLMFPCGSRKMWVGAFFVLLCPPPRVGKHKSDWQASLFLVLLRKKCPCVQLDDLPPAPQRIQGLKAMDKFDQGTSTLLDDGHVEGAILSDHLFWNVGCGTLNKPT